MINAFTRQDILAFTQDIDFIRYTHWYYMLSTILLYILAYITA